MKTFDSKVGEHYDQLEIYQQIKAGLKRRGISLNSLSTSDLQEFDELHVRGHEVSRELAGDTALSNLNILDVGCGIGGPARFLANEYGCKVTGIDLSCDFVKTAKRLSDLSGLKNRTNFIQGNALKLPFEDESFQLVWTQHAQMNIADKLRFYFEIYRVLEAQGKFLYYDIFSIEKKDIDYPVPWAGSPSISILETRSAVESILLKLGFKMIQTKEQTEKGIISLRHTIAQLDKKQKQKEESLYRIKINNLLKGLEQKKIELASGVFQKIQ